MGQILTYTRSPWQENYSEIIDVRSPEEFAEDRLPGAINLPVLNDEERAKVGTLYKQISPFEARKIGAGIVSQNISCHLQEHFVHKTKQYFPLIYCWRGGQRSNSLALVLAQIGWRVTVLTGGYKTYRAYVRQRLESLPSQFKYRLICGLTGTGKTRILQVLARQGEQVLDLEKLASHRGSLLGQEWEEQPQPQPSQKRFDSLLLQELQKFDASKPVWVESESNKIGEVYLPPALWEEMKRARGIEIQLPLATRVAWLLQEYSHLTTCPELLKNKLTKLRSRYGWEKFNQWCRAIERGEFPILVEDLLATHYDPAYRRSLLQTYQQVERVLALADLSDESIESALSHLEI